MDTLTAWFFECFQRSLDKITAGVKVTVIKNSCYLTAFMAVASLIVSVTDEMIDRWFISIML